MCSLTPLLTSEKIPGAERLLQQLEPGLCQASHTHPVPMHGMAFKAPFLGTETEFLWTLSVTPVQAVTERGCQELPPLCLPLGSQEWIYSAGSTAPALPEQGGTEPHSFPQHG